MNTPDPHSGQVSFSWGGNDGLPAFLELFPVPMEVFGPDGLSWFVNRAFSDFFGIRPEQIVGKFNVLQDPYLNSVPGLTPYLHRVFAGEILSFHDLKAPLEEIDRRYGPGRSKPAGHELYQDISCFPLGDERGALSCVVALFMTKRVYQLRQDAVRARDYIDGHWLDDFDLNEIARAVDMSSHYLAHLFKKTLGLTLYSYYQEVKIEKIKVALADPGLSVREAFASCGADYSGSFAEAFKRKVGLTPTQYRSALPSPGPKGPSRAQGLPTAAPSNLSEQALFQLAQRFPIPIQIFRPDGAIAFVNEAVLSMWNVRDTSLILGKYNLLTDPLVNEDFGLRGEIRRAFRGETVLISDVRVPLERFWQWYKTRSAVFDVEAIYTDILNFPLWGDEGRMAYMVSVFFTSRVYQGRAEVARAREHLENTWREEFDAAALASAARLSPSQLGRLFKKQTGMSPYSYYQALKISGLKAALRDQNLSIAQAFVSCGFEYPGNCARFFKEKTGMTPSQYRRGLEK